MLDMLVDGGLYISNNILYAWDLHVEDVTNRAVVAGVVVAEGVDGCLDAIEFVAEFLGDDVGERSRHGQCEGVL